MMTHSQAEILALKALGWIVAQDELRPVFVGATGQGEADLAARAGEADFQAAVLDFLCMDDTWVIGFCDAEKIDYAGPMTARAVLAGPGAMHWT